MEEDGTKVGATVNTTSDAAVESSRPMVGSQVAEEYRSYLIACAAQFCRSYDDREELVSRVILALLEYDKPILHPHKFIRITTKNLALNSARVGSGLWETVESEIADSAEADDYKNLCSNDGGADADTETVVVLKDTLLRLEDKLSPGERRCYELLKAGLEQRDLAKALGISRQGVYKILRSIRRKYELADREA